MPPASRVSNCSYCSFCSDDNITFVKHLFQAHSSERNFQHVCGITSCPHTFNAATTYASFLTHCNRKHRNLREILSRQDIIEPTRSISEDPRLQLPDSPEGHDTQPEGMDLDVVDHFLGN